MSKHYLVIDYGTQWFTKLVRTLSDKPNENGWIDADLIDVPNEIKAEPFLRNVYARDNVEGELRFNRDNTGWGGWTISPAEHERIARLIALVPSVNEYRRLAAYP